MKHRALDLFLFMVLIVGSVLAGKTGWERNRLTARYIHLAHIAGDLIVQDPSKCHVLALKTEVPLHFGWRIYRPPGHRQLYYDSFGHLGASGPSWPLRAEEKIAHILFREEQGHLQVTNQVTGNETEITDRALIELLHARWDKICVEQMGTSSTDILEPDQPSLLLRLTLPQDMQAEAREKLAPDVLKKYVPVLYEVYLGPKAGKPLPSP